MKYSLVINKNPLKYYFLHHKQHRRLSIKSWNFRVYQSKSHFQPNRFFIHIIFTILSMLHTHSCRWWCAQCFHFQTGIKIIFRWLSGVIYFAFASDQHFQRKSLFSPIHSESYAARFGTCYSHICQSNKIAVLMDFLVQCQHPQLSDRATYAKTHTETRTLVDCRQAYKQWPMQRHFTAEV